MADSSRDPQALAEACAAAMYAEDDASQDLGITIANVAPGTAEARMTVTENMVNGHDICHGGFIFTLADTAFAFACNTYGRVTVAAGASIEFLKPVRRGEALTASAVEAYRGQRTGFYDVRVTSAGDRLVALFRGRSATLDEDIPLPD